MILASALVLFAAAQPQPQGAAVDCILGGIPAADRSAIYDEVTERGGSADPALQRLAATAENCQDRLGIAEEQIVVAMMLAHSAVLRDLAGAELGRNGLALAAVDRWIAAQPDAVRLRPEMDEDSVIGLIDALHEGGVAMEALEASGTAIGVYFAAVSIMERLRRGLPIE